MTNYTKYFSKRVTPQSQPIPGKNMVKNSAGGYVFQTDDFTRLDRFLVLGTENGTYYASERKLTVENGQCVERCLKQDYKRTIDRIVEISITGRAPKNDPALFALAIAAGNSDPLVRAYALENLSKVARIGTHLFNFVDAVQHFRGWGRGLRRAIARWYTEKPADKLAYQVIKYQQRNGWSHRDLLRLGHPQAPSDDHQAIFRYIVKGRENDLTDVSKVPENLRLIWAWERAKQVEHASEMVQLITEYGLPHECVPNKFKKQLAVWDALVQKMPMGATIRNLGRMTNVGLLKPGSEATKVVVNRLSDAEQIKRSRLHPISVLAALITYKSGHGHRGSLSWTPVSSVVDALDDAFYAAFGNVEPTGKSTLIALDVSSSMGWGRIAGIPGLVPSVGAAAMAMVTARTEPHYQIVGFSNTLKDLNISAKDSLDSVMRKTFDMTFGSTNCALPMVHSLEQGWRFENFAIYTDNETWSGHIQPVQALQQYRQKTGLGARLAVVGMSATSFSIADPNDAGMLDVVGFDTAAPNIISNFFRGE